jgi:hypothetical protein
MLGKIPRTVVTNRTTYFSLHSFFAIPRKKGFFCHGRLPSADPRFDSQSIEKKKNDSKCKCSMIIGQMKVQNAHNTGEMCRLVSTNYRAFKGNYISSLQLLHNLKAF